MGKKTPAGEKVKRQLPFKLSDEEKARKGEEAAKINAKADKAMLLKKSDMDMHNKMIKSLVVKRDVLLKSINEGIEHREVNCVEVKNYDDNKIEYWYEGEVLDSRDMRPEDRQQTLTEPKAKKPNRWQKRHPVSSEEAREQEEIAQVHKLETSKRGAQSMVDPK